MEYDKNELEELLILYALGELEPEEATAVEEEIRKRPELAAQVEKARSVDGLLTDVFAQSVEPVPQVIAEESEKPIVANKVEKPQGRLAQRLAFSVAALALVLVVGALIYPQLVSKDAQVAMTSSDDVKDSSVSTRPEVKNARLASPAPSTPDSPALPEDESVAINDAEDVVPPEAGAEDANTGIADVAMEEDANVPPASASPDSENVHPELPANNTFADDSSPKTAGGVMSFKGISSVDQERPEASLGEMAVDQMNKRLDSQQR